MGVSAPPGAVTILFTDGHLLDQDRLFSAFGLTEQLPPGLLVDGRQIGCAGTLQHDRDSAPSTHSPG